jgi:1-acyl-sn-glycerol-3-phosphate acyltransferase
MNAFQVFALNAWFYPLLVLYSLIVVPVSAAWVAAQALFIPHRRALRLFRRAIRWYGFGIVYALPRPWIRVRYEAAAPLPSPCLVVCNHRSASDPFLMACLPLPEFVQIMNTWIKKLPVWGIMAQWAGYLSVREMAAEEFQNRAGSLLREGVSLVAFPEGTRSGNRCMGPFHGTVFRLALKERIPIVPVCISGNERMPLRGSVVLRPGNVRVRSLPPVPWDDYRDMKPFQLKNRIRTLIQQELDRMEAV